MNTMCSFPFVFPWTAESAQDDRSHLLKAGIRSIDRNEIGSSVMLQLALHVILYCMDLQDTIFLIQVWSVKAEPCPLSLEIKVCPTSYQHVHMILQIASYRDEDCIMQHLSAASVGSTHQIGQRGHFPVCQSTAVQCHPNFVHDSGAPAGVPSPLATSVPVMSPQQSTRSDAIATALTFPQYLSANSISSSSGTGILRWDPSGSVSDLPVQYSYILNLTKQRTNYGKNLPHLKQ